ncbi:MAG: dTMP kinase [Candidatus Omnitrophota bacterium]|nr:dTMP kinase [Candidatus Omnitrophota bacterium]
MAKKSLKKGLFITFEGIEGCGKSTHSRLLLDYLKKNGYSCVITREPGGTKLGEEVRKILLNSDGLHISDLTELFLFEACRRQIVEDIITPAIKRKNIIICDRFSDATFSYQGYGGKVDMNIIEKIDDVATNSLAPDLTILLDIDTVEGLRRAKKKGTDRIESKDVAYHKRVRKGYLELARKYPKRIKVIKVDGEIPKVQSLVRREVDNVLRRY